MSIRVGDRLPNFEADAYFPDGKIRPLKFADYKGKWVVLFFYPLDFTFVCPTEIKAFNQQCDQFRKANAEIIGVSTDSSYSHKAWTENGLGKVAFPLIGDTNHAVSRLFGVLVEEKGIALRGTFIIDPEGKVVSANVNDLKVGRSVDETLRLLKAFQTGELVQCGWQPGQATLKA
jgi:alkyl hydroperoxide reductase subunit AhpC